MIKGKTIKILVFLLVLIFTFILRAHNYDRTPTPNHLDEMLYAWSGLYLIEEGVPVSWSTLPYPIRAQVFVGERNYGGGAPKASVTLYKPWLDEPPLFSLLVGSFAHHFDADRAQFVPSSYIRLPLIYIAAIVSLLIFVIASKVAGFWSGIIAMLIYGTTPVIVFSSRTAMPENVIALLYLMAVYLLIKFWQKPQIKYLYLTPVLAGVAGLCKPTGYFILPFVIFVMALRLKQTQKRWFKQALRYSLWLVILLLPFILAYLAYGAHYDWEIFKRIMDVQGHRPAGFGALAWFFITPSYDTAILRDSVYVFCLMSAVYFIFKKQANPLETIIVYAFIYWVMMIMLSGGENDLLAWYRYPVLPLLSILGSWGILKLIKRADFLATFLAAGLLLGNRMLIVTSVRPNIQPVVFRNLFMGIMAPSILYTVFGGKLLKQVCRGVVIVVFLVGVYFSSVYIYSAYEIGCEGLKCPMVPQTKLGTLKFPYFWRFFVRDEPWNYK